MKDRIAQLVTGLSTSPEIVTACLAALPVTELRFSIPYAIFALKLNWSTALLWSLIGNLLPVPVILLLLDPAQAMMRRWSTMDRFFDWLFARTRRRGKIVERFRVIGLALFVAIPLPITGAWTGSVAAYLFGIRFAPAMVAISIGVSIAGIIISLACEGFLGFWNLGAHF